jgi:FkbM family methyltransferase
MSVVEMTEGVGDEPTPFKFALVPTWKPEQLLEHVRSAVSRGLPEISECKAHSEILSVAGGGPSIADTYKEMTGYVAAINGSLAWLLDQNIVPQMCGVCDPTEKIADVLEAHKDVTYFIASCAHPKVFDKLIGAGCRVYLWHLHPIDGLDELLTGLYPGGWTQISGGCTMGLRWVNLGYHIGFRTFHLHGLDSSFRDKSSHAYPDHQDGKDWLTFDGYWTRPNFLGQVVDFERMLVEMDNLYVEPTKLEVFGDGLLQSRYRHWMAIGQQFAWPAWDKTGKSNIRREARTIKDFLDRIPGRGVVVQAGGNIGLYPAYLAQVFKQVITFEPDPDNWTCLQQNIGSVPNITAHNAALGSHYGGVATVCHEAGNCGAVRVIEGGSTPRTTIDALGLKECDLIWLDVEGYEEMALQGAALTIDKFKPAVIIEENGVSAKTYHQLDAFGAAFWLAERGYKHRFKMGYDNLYTC